MVSFDITAKFKQNKQGFLFTVIHGNTEPNSVPTQFCQCFKFTGCVSPDEKLG